MVRPGDVLAGKYRVEHILGTGGMGVVVAAHHLQLDEKVALKFLLPHALANPEAVSRFAREARAAVKIKGEHVARVSDVGELENGSPYIVMEYLEGIDLSTWLRDRGALPIELAVDFVLQACEAIADAHALGIVHRDLKPANLFCVARTDGQPCIKVLDFGISKLTAPGATSHDMTRTTALVGSPYYMSPEQLHSSKTVDTRTDIWSLGVILFELVSGRVPFAADAVTELAIRIAMDAAPPVRAFRGDAPPGLEQVIMTALEKDRNRRFQTVGELAVALREFGSKQAGASVERILGTLRQAGMAGGAPPSPGELRGGTTLAVGLQGAQQTGASWGQTGSRSPSAGAKAAVAIALILALGVIAAAVVVFVRRSRVASEAPPVAAAASSVAAVTTGSASPPADSTTEVLSPLPSATGTETPPAPSTTATPVATTTPAVRPTVTPVRPAATAPAKGNCDPPYYYNAKGTRIFKQECL